MNRFRTHRRARRALFWASGVSFALLACVQGEETPVERGERIYRASCVACHNLDPGREGPLGPAIAGASEALVEARVMRAEYPPGHTPQRDTQLMPAQPFLGPEVPYLAAYLSSLSRTPDDS